jgi:hypothetical protein
MLPEVPWAQLALQLGQAAGGCRSTARTAMEVPRGPPPSWLACLGVVDTLSGAATSPAVALYDSCGSTHAMNISKP